MESSLSHITALQGKRLVWVGPRASDIDCTKGLFSGSVTLMGPVAENSVSYCGAKSRRINHNIATDDQENFINVELRKLIEADDDVAFMSYDSNLVFACDDEVVRRTICLNERSTMELLNCKTSFRSWSAERACTHRSLLLAGSACGYDDLRLRFGCEGPFVIQRNRAVGGEGTFMVSRENSGIVAEECSQDELFLVSRYVKHNIPLNIHAVIYAEDILVFPPSIQIIDSHGDKLHYRGADFIEARRVPVDVIERFKADVRNLCADLQGRGYRGIVGFDAIVYDGRAHLLECNNRFQASTLLLNRALEEAGLPSMQEFVIESFFRPAPSVPYDGVEVDASSYAYSADKQGRRPLAPLDFERDGQAVDFYDEGLAKDDVLEPGAYLMRAVFSTNIVSITPDGSVALHPNIEEGSLAWHDAIVVRHDPLRLKIALTNQGVYVTEEARALLSERGGMREGVHFAIDISFPSMDGLVVNSPLSVKFANLSPFGVEVRKGELVLSHYGTDVMPIEIMPFDNLGNMRTSRNVELRYICLIATDRVRVQHARHCIFKESGKGCDFCEVTNETEAFELEDVFEGIDAYLASDYPFHHFLIGGRSGGASEIEDTLAIARHITKACGYPIYLMIVPPQDVSVLSAYQEAGVTEVAFNVELWDRALARRWMPGKGAIPLERYLAALKEAVRLWGASGAVRSCFVVGLERDETLMEGIETLSALGVAPVLSVFRPIPGTAGADLIPPSNDYLLDLYLRAQAVCEKHGLRLGPTCTACQNNTLSLPEALIEKRSNGAQL